MATRRRKRRTFLNTSDEEYMVSDDTSSANETDTTAEDNSPVRTSRRGSARVKKVSDSRLKRSHRNTEDPKVLRERVPIASGLKRSHVFAGTTPSEEPVLSDKSFKGSLLTPPPRVLSPSATVTPISLVSTPQTVIQTHSHTISGIELLPSVSESGTHVTTVEGVPLLELLEQTPPMTPSNHGNTKPGINWYS